MPFFCQKRNICCLNILQRSNTGSRESQSQPENKLTMKLTSNIIDNYSNRRIADVRWNQTTKSFLSSRVPQLQPNLTNEETYYRHVHCTHLPAHLLNGRLTNSPIITTVIIPFFFFHICGFIFQGLPDTEPHHNLQSEVWTNRHPTSS